MTTVSRPSATRLHVFRLLAVGVLPLAFLAALELGLRLAGVGFDPAFLVPVPTREAEARTTNQGFGKRFFPPTIARYPAVEELAWPKPPGRLRIAVLGGSAAMGVPEPAFSAGRQLEAMLRLRHPTADVEVVNAAMTAINSHVVREIAEDLARHEVDLFVVYLGNNEVVGPWGAGTTLGRRGLPLPLVRASVELRELRLGQAIEDLGRRLRPGPAAADASRWRGMEMFADQRIDSDDPRLERVARHLEANLEAILDVARSDGAGVLVSSVVTDLRDQPPFGSSSPESLPAAARERWQGAWERGLALDAVCGTDVPTQDELDASSSAAEREVASAVRAFEEAARAFPLHAETWYRLARCLLASSRPEDARAAFVAARDHDVLRFRATSAIQETLQRVALRRGGSADPGIRWVDAEALLSRHPLVGDGIPGRELLEEHVHPTFRGNHALAGAWLPEVEAALPGLSPVGDPPPTPERVSHWLARTPFDEWRVAADIRKLRSSDLFTGLPGAAESSRREEERLDALRARAHDPGVLATAGRRFEEVLARRPGDHHVRSRFAALLRHRGDPGRAAEELERLLTRVPGTFVWTTELGHARADLGDWDAAERAYGEARSIDPHALAPLFDLGIVALRRGAPDRALERFDAVLASDPRHLQALVNRGAALEALGRRDEAEGSYRRATEVDPTSALAWFDLGAILAARGRTAAAVDAYERALELRPDHPGAGFNLGVALERLGRIDAAAGRYRTVLAHHPESAPARTNLVALVERRAAEHASRGEMDPAIEGFREAIRLASDRPEAHVNLARALAIAGRRDEAAAEARKALALAPGFGPARELLAALGG